MPEEQRASPPTPIICQSSALCKMRETHLHIYDFPSYVDSSLFESLLNQHSEKNVSRKWSFKTKAHIFPYRPSYQTLLYLENESHSSEIVACNLCWWYIKPSKSHNKIAQRKIVLLRGCSVINQLCVLSYIHISTFFS